MTTTKEIRLTYSASLKDTHPIRAPGVICATLDFNRTAGSSCILIIRLDSGDEVAYVAISRDLMFKVLKSCTVKYRMYSEGGIPTNLIATLSYGDGNLVSV